MDAASSHEDAVVSEFLRSIGDWSTYVIIGGGYALIVYKLYFSEKQSGSSPVGTRDIDSLIPRKVTKVSEKNISSLLCDAGFKKTLRGIETPPSEAYTKEINGCEVEIEFLTDSETRDDKQKNVVVAGIVAQPLSYLSLSLRTTLTFRTRSGEEGRVVSPGAWMFHKGLTFPRRKDPLKIFKDLYGIWYAASQLGEFSKHAVEGFRLLRTHHVQWYKTFQRNLAAWKEGASPLDWSMLEMQDPHGKLKRSNFEHVIQQLVE